MDFSDGLLSGKTAIGIRDDVNERAKRSGNNVSRPSAAGMPQRSLHVCETQEYLRRVCVVVDRAVY